MGNGRINRWPTGGQSSKGAVLICNCNCKHKLTSSSDHLHCIISSGSLKDGGSTFEKLAGPLVALLKITVSPGWHFAGSQWARWARGASGRVDPKPLLSRGVAMSMPPPPFPPPAPAPPPSPGSASLGCEDPGACVYFDVSDREILTSLGIFAFLAGCLLLLFGVLRHRSPIFFGRRRLRNLVRPRRTRRSNHRATVTRFLVVASLLRSSRAPPSPHRP